MLSIILFAVWAGTEKFKNVFRNGQKQTKKCKMCSTYGSSGRCHGNACRINVVLVLVFNRGDIWLFQGTVFSPKFQNLFFSKI